MYVSTKGALASGILLPQIGQPISPVDTVERHETAEDQVAIVFIQGTRQRLAAQRSKSLTLLAYFRGCVLGTCSEAHYDKCWHECLPLDIHARAASRSPSALDAYQTTSVGHVHADMDLGQAAGRTNKEVSENGVSGVSIKPRMVPITSPCNTNCSQYRSLL
jgi:hypothetical protein